MTNQEILDGFLRICMPIQKFTFEGGTLVFNNSEKGKMVTFLDITLAPIKTSTWDIYISDRELILQLDTSKFFYEEFNEKWKSFRFRNEEERSFEMFMT